MTLMVGGHYFEGVHARTHACPRLCVSRSWSRRWRPNFPGPWDVRQKWGFFPKPPWDLPGGLHPWKGWFRREVALSCWIPVWGLGNKGCFPEVQEGVCVCVWCVAKAPGGWRRWSFMEKDAGPFCCQSLFDPLVLEDQQKRGTT